MPRGIANLFSTLPTIDLLKRVENHLNREGITIEIPETSKVQVWTSEGDMLQIEKTELLSKDSEISNYLIQFWWPEKDDISIKLFREGHLCVCDIYLDGLNDSQFRDITDVLITMTQDSSENFGFVIDKYERTSDFDWTGFYVSNKFINKHKLEECGLSLYMEYEIGTDHKKFLKDLKQDYVYIGFLNCEKRKLVLYILN